MVCWPLMISALLPPSWSGMRVAWWADAVLGPAAADALHTRKNINCFGCHGNLSPAYNTPQRDPASCRPSASHTEPQPDSSQTSSRANVIYNALEDPPPKAKGQVRKPNHPEPRERGPAAQGSRTTQTNCVECLVCTATAATHIYGNIHTYKPQPRPRPAVSSS